MLKRCLKWWGVLFFSVVIAACASRSPVEPTEVEATWTGREGSAATSKRFFLNTQGVRPSEALCRNGRDGFARSEYGGSEELRLHSQGGLPVDREKRGLVNIIYRDFVVGYDVRFRTPLWTQMNLKTRSSCRSGQGQSRWSCEPSLKKDHVAS